MSASPANRSTWSPSVPDLVAIGVATLLAFAAATTLTQSDGDLFAHIAFGREILRTHQIPRTSVLGLAPLSGPLVSPAWGAALLFALLDRVAGLALIAAFISVIAGATHALLASYLRKQSGDPMFVIVASLIGFVLASSHWLARPHAFSLAAAAVLLLLMEGAPRRAVVLAPPLFVAWANLHGGWSFGLIAMGAYIAGLFADHLRASTPASRARVVQLSVAYVLSWLATLVTPYGAQLHLAVVRTLTDASVSGVIDEYQPLSLRSVPDVFFLLTLGGALWILVRRGRRIPIAHALVIAACALFAVRASRNISLFGVTAWPLLAIHLAPSVSPWLRRLSLHEQLARYDARRSPGRAGALVLAILLGVGLGGGRVAGATLIDGAVDARRFPVAAVERLGRGNEEGRLLTTWTWSGYLPFAWPGRRSFFDPLAFTPQTVESFGTMLLARTGWRHELDARDITMVLAPRHLPLADSLRSIEDWSTWHEDSTAIVLLRVTTTDRVRP